MIAPNLFFAMGALYYFGYGVTQDYDEAIKYFRKAAEKNIVEAQLILGTLYCNGENVPKNNHEAVKWLSKAAEQGLAEAQWRLGFCYRDGEGVEQNHSKAKELFEKAAMQGDAASQYIFGSYIFYEEKDYKKGLEWVRKSAAQGFDKAQKMLDEYHESYGGRRNFIAAASSMVLILAEQTSQYRKLL